MLKRLRLGLLILLALGGVAGTIVGVTYEEQKARVKYQRECEEHSTPVLVGNPEKNKSSNNKCEDAKDYMPWWYVLVAWPDGVVVWAIIATGIVIGWQGYETRRAANAAAISAKDARESIALTHRPKIIIRSVVIPWMQILNRKTPLKVLNENKLDDGQLGGSFYAVNVGDLPATICSLDQCLFWGDGLPMERPYEDGQSRKVLNIRINAGGSCKISFIPKATSSKELAVAAVYEHPFFAIGRIIYTDELGISRETAFCRKIDHAAVRMVTVSDPDYEYSD